MLFISRRNTPQWLFPCKAAGDNDNFKALCDNSLKGHEHDSKICAVKRDKVVLSTTSPVKTQKSETVKDENRRRTIKEISFFGPKDTLQQNWMKKTNTENPECCPPSLDAMMCIMDLAAELEIWE